MNEAQAKASWVGAVILVGTIGGLFAATWSPTRTDREKAAVYDACLAGEGGRCRQCAVEDPNRDRRAACVTLLMFDSRRVGE